MPRIGHGGAGYADQSMLEGILPILGLSHRPYRWRRAVERLFDREVRKLVGGPGLYSRRCRACTASEFRAGRRYGHAERPGTGSVHGGSQRSARYPGSAFGVGGSSSPRHRQLPVLVLYVGRTREPSQRGARGRHACHGHQPLARRADVCACRVQAVSQRGLGTSGRCACMCVIRTELELSHCGLCGFTFTPLLVLGDTADGGGVEEGDSSSAELLQLRREPVARRTAGNRAALHGFGGDAW
ncbi:hypothetical protein CBM2589_B120353 [Cupriavidus taiwanensis]|uniref:Uncharacterized protein n=1 Tax=Cupriavidus taiwanensis TaxID=164546 RepID=A0A975ZY90_9BURK|nr:hypothetical protein CBM2589_B120353 [Cupriavidus taiwanensis]